MDLMTGFIHRSTDSSEYVTNHPMSCGECGGTGEVSEMQMQCKRIGQFVRQGRQELDLSLSEAATVNRWPVRFQNELEMGRLGEYQP